MYNASIFTYLLFISVSSYQLDRYIQRFYSYLFIVHLSEQPLARPLHTTLLHLLIYCSSELHSLVCSGLASSCQLDRYIQRFYIYLFIVHLSEQPLGRPQKRFYGLASSYSLRLSSYQLEHTTLLYLLIYCSSE